jgi:hypothetical protein
LIGPRPYATLIERQHVVYAKGPATGDRNLAETARCGQAPDAYDFRDEHDDLFELMAGAVYGHCSTLR